MKSTVLFATNCWLFAMNWSDLPSFDWRAALIVGAIVAVVAVAVLAVAIVTPIVAIQAGATLLGTCVAVGGIALTTGVVAGVAAGFYQGNKGDAEHGNAVEKIKLVSNQIDIYFKPSSDPKRAADFQCTIVVYEETNLNSRPPTITTKQVRIDAYNSNEFYGEIDQFLNRWFTKPVGRDAPGHPRRVKVYMTPYPGEGVYEQIKQMAEKSVIRNCVVVKTEGTWESAWTE